MAVLAIKATRGRPVSVRKNSIPCAASGPYRQRVIGEAPTRAIHSVEDSVWKQLMRRCVIVLGRTSCPLDVSGCSLRGTLRPEPI